MRPGRQLLAAFLASCFACGSASAQLGRAVPGASYFAALDELYNAQLNRAARGFQNEIRGGIRTVQTRWIDSICYFTMLGETLFRQHAYGPALEQFDLAIDLFLANRQWLQSVRLDPPVREDMSLGRRLPAWARPARQPRYLDPPASFLTAVGRIDNSQQAQQGGVVQQAQFWQLDAMELARCIAWVIYRRGELLGPLAPEDARQRAVNDAVTRGGLAPPSPWTDAWTCVWQGVAASAIGRDKTAAPLLERGTLVAGQLDYPLTPLVLLVRGKMALRAGQAAAPDLLREAVLAGVAMEDYLVVTEALRAAHALRLSIDTSPIPWLDPLAAWATQRGFDETAILCRLAIAESLLESGKTAEANQWLGAAFARNRPASRGPLSFEAERLSIVAASQSGAADEARTRLGALIESKAPLSLRRFRIALANEQVRTGRLSQRVAVDVYERLLADPTAADFRESPLDSIVALQDPNVEAFGRWFEAAVSRRNDESMLRVADAERRRRWLATLAAGGRIASLRRLLEGPAEPLGDAAVAAKGAVLDRRRDYADLSVRADRLIGQLSLETGAASARRDWEATIDARENLLTQIALSRLETPLVAIPPLDGDIDEQIGEELPGGHAIVAFRVGETDTYALSVTSNGPRSWRVGRTRDLQRALVDFLKSIVGAGARQQWTPELLADNSWQTQAEELGDLLFGQAPVDVVAAARLTIVPDGPLWYTPWNALVLGNGTDEPTTLFERGPVAVSTTIGAALSDKSELRPIGTTAVIPPLAASPEVRDPVLGRAPGGVRLGVRPGASLPMVKALSDAVVVGLDQSLAIDDPFGVAMMPVSRGEFATLSDWGRLPQSAPTLAMIDGLRTGAEDLPSTLRSRKRGARRPGDEVFLAVCALMAPGVDSAVITLWPSGGLRERDLLAEMLVGVQLLPPRDAWKRSVEIGRPRKLDPSREPRLELPEDSEVSPDASHPFWWAPFLLIE